MKRVEKVVSSDDFYFQGRKLCRKTRRRFEIKSKQAIVKIFGKESTIPYDIAKKEQLKIIRVI